MADEKSEGVIPTKPVPARRPATPLETFSIQLVSEKGDYYKKIVNYFAGDDDRARKFMSAVVYSVQKNPKLLDANRDSLMQAAMACAEFQLYPSNVAGEAFIIPYKGKAQFQLGYQGIITLFYRNGITLRSEIVRKDDVFEYVEGLETHLVHKPDPFKSAEQRGEPIGAYAIATLADGRTYHKVMNREDILAFRKFSQSFTSGSEYSPWKDGNDPELWMWKKTVIKQLAKTIPKTEQIQKAMAEDDDESTIAERKNALDAGGPAVPRASHRPEAPAGPPCLNCGDPKVTHIDVSCPVGKCGRHPLWKTDKDGDCADCVAEALEAEAKKQDDGLPAIAA